MILCKRCDKDNQEHYKFCLGCGAELPRTQIEAKGGLVAPTPPGGVSAVRRSSGPPMPSGASNGFADGPATDVVASVAPAVDANKTCSNCGGEVPPDFRFCGTCGHDVSSGSAPGWEPAPPPAEPVAPAVEVEVETSQGSGIKLTVIQSDGTDGSAHELARGVSTIGRDIGGVFGHDAYLSPQHAEYRVDNGEVFVRDLDSLNGVYLRLAPEMPAELEDGSVFRVGQEIIKYEAPALGTSTPPYGTELMGSSHGGYLGRLCLVVGREASADCMALSARGLFLGRERGDMLFPEDGYVSGLHCQVHGEAGRVYLTDLGSSNGTFVRVRGEVAVSAGSYLLMGQQLFRVDA